MPSHAFSQVLVPASTYDLIDLPTVKDELSLKSVDTSNDNFLNRAITQSSAAAANYCNRIFQVETLIGSHPQLHIESTEQALDGVVLRIISS